MHNHFTTISLDSQGKWTALVNIQILRSLTLDYVGPMASILQWKHFPPPYLALNSSTCHIYLAMTPNLHLPVSLHDRLPKSVASDENRPASVSIKCT